MIMTLEERAKIATADKHEGNIVTVITAQGAYIKGATDQKQIDDREMSDALFIQRQMFFEKACNAFCANCEVGQAVCKSLNISCPEYKDFKKAMEE